MSRVPMGSDGGAWAMDPETNYDTSFVPQGVGADLIATVEGFTRDDVDAYAVRCQERAATAQKEGRFANSVVPVLDLNENVVLDHDEFIRPGTTVETLAGLKPSFAMMGEHGGFDAVALQKYHWVEAIDHVHTPGNSSGIVDGATLLAIGNEQVGKDLGPQAARAHPRHRGLRRRPDDHAHRPRARHAQGAQEGRPDDRRHRPDRDERGLRGRRPALRQGHGRRHGARSTSTAARSPWATRSARPAG